MTATPRQRPGEQQTATVVACALLLLFFAARATAAVDEVCTVTENKARRTLNGAVLDVVYDLVAPADVSACDVSLRLSIDGGKTYLAPNQFRVQGNIGRVAVGPGRLIRVEILTPGPLDFDLIVPDLVAVPSRRRFRAAATWFGSLGEPDGVEWLGQHRSRGATFVAGVPFRKSLEFNVEVSVPGIRDALDSAVVNSVPEKRSLIDTMFTGLLGRSTRVGQRAQLVVLGGGGFSLLDTRRFQYTFADAKVQPADESESRVKAVFGGGLDLRLAVWRRLFMVAQDRLYFIPGADVEPLRRSTLQQRLGVGIQVAAGSQ